MGEREGERGVERERERGGGGGEREGGGGVERERKRWGSESKVG